MRLFHLSLTALVFALLTSCTSIRYAEPSRMLSVMEVQEDIDKLIQELQSRHIDLNWEGRETQIINDLQAIKSINQPITVEQFERQLEVIMKTIDDGHSKILSLKKSKRKQTEKAPEFSAMQLDSHTVYCKVGNFLDHYELNKVRHQVEDMTNPGIHQRLILDFRGNHGGEETCVKALLQTFMTKNFVMYDTTFVKPKKGYISFMYNLNRRLYGYRKKGDRLAKPGKEVRTNGKIKLKDRYLLVDSTIISGSMVASYHLIQDGFVVVGSNPTSLFNSFGNATAVLLNNSHLYAFMSTARLKINENHDSRDLDQLICDIQTDKSQLPEILNLVKAHEARERRDSR